MIIRWNANIRGENNKSTETLENLKQFFWLSFYQVLNHPVIKDFTVTIGSNTVLLLCLKNNRTENTVPYTTFDDMFSWKTFKV